MSRFHWHFHFRGIWNRARSFGKNYPKRIAQWALAISCYPGNDSDSKNVTFCIISFKRKIFFLDFSICDWFCCIVGFKWGRELRWFENMLYNNWLYSWPQIISSLINSLFVSMLLETHEVLTIDLASFTSLASLKLVRNNESMSVDFPRPDSPTTIIVNSNPFLIAFRFIWFGRFANPT